MEKVKVLLLSQCTNEKAIKSAACLNMNDFKGDIECKIKEKKLKKISAYEMYAGDQHMLICKGLKKLREKNKKDNVDFYIVSAGYGLINEKDMVAPYNVTFKDMKKRDLLNWSRYLNIHTKLQMLVKSYDLIFIMLGNNYLKSLEFPIEFKKDAKIVFFTNEKTYENINCNNKFFINCGKQKSKSPYGFIGLKGYYFNKISEYLCKNWIGFETIYNDPNILSKMIT